MWCHVSSVVALDWVDLTNVTCEMFGYVQHLKLVKMWPGGTLHVVVRTLKMSLDRLKKKKKEFSRVL